MAAAQSITCPKCRSKLKLAAPAAPGTRMRCPKCGTAFRAPETSDSPYDGDDPSDARPAAPRRSGRRRKRTSAVGLKVPLMILGTAIVLAGAGVGIAVLVKHLPDDLTESLDLPNLAGELGIGGGIDFTYMPGGTQQFFVIRPRARWNSSISQELRDPDESVELLSRFEESTGFPFTSIETVTRFRGGSSPEVVVVELVATVDPETITSRIPGVEAVEHSGETLYRFRGGGQQRALLFVSGTTFLVGPESAVTSIIDGTFTAGDSSAFAFVDADGGLIDATTSVDREGPFLHLAFEFPFMGGFTEFENLYRDQAVALSGCEKLDDRADYRQSIRFVNEETAGAALGWLEQQLAEKRDGVAGSLTRIESRLEEVRESEQDRVERAARGENPFSRGIGNRVDEIEKLLENEQHVSATLDACSVSRSGCVVTLAMRLSSEDLAHQDKMRRSIARERTLPLINDWLGWGPEINYDSEKITEELMAEVLSERDPLPGESRVTRFTYRITEFRGRDRAWDVGQLEEALLRVNSYVPESVTVDVAQATISFEVTNHLEDGITELHRIGLFIDRATVQKEESWRVVPERERPSILHELKIVSMRRGVSESLAAAEESLRRMNGYVANSVAIDDAAERFTAEFTYRISPVSIIGLMRGGPGLTLQALPEERRTDVPGSAFYISIYYEMYTGEKPVAETVREMVEGQGGYVADTLQHDEDMHYIVFQVAPEYRAVPVPLFDSGFRRFVSAVAREPKSLVYLKDQRPSR